MAGEAAAAPVVEFRALGELLALLLGLAGLALFGSELAGVGWRSADKLVFLTPLFVSECALLGGETDRVRGGVRRGGAVGAAAGITGRGPWGLRALVVARRGSIRTACAVCAAWAACIWRWCERGDRLWARRACGVCGAGGAGGACGTSGACGAYAGCVVTGTRW